MATVAILVAFASAVLAFTGVLWTQVQTDRRAERDRRAQQDAENVKETWRRAADKRTRLAAEFESVLRGANHLAALVGPINWTPDNRRSDEEVQRIREALATVYKELQVADARLKLEGMFEVARRMHDLAVHYHLFQNALRFLGDPQLRGAGVNFFDHLQVEARAISDGRDELERLLPQVLDAVLPAQAQQLDCTHKLTAHD